MRTPLIIVLATSCAAVGCDRGELPTPALASTERSDIPGAADVGRPRYGWYQTHGDEASHVLVTTLSIPGLFDAKTDEIRIARYVRIDAEGMMQLPPGTEYRTMAFADGGNEKGGFGYGGGINVADDEVDDDAIILDVSYYWTTPDQVRGELREKVRAKIGTPVDAALPGGGRLQVSWRELERP